MNFLVALAINLFILLITPVPKPPRPKQYSLSEFQVPTAEEGRAVPLVFGTAEVAGNVVGLFDYLAREVTKKVKVNLLKSTRQVVGYKYHVGMWMTLSLGRAEAIVSAKWGDRVIWQGEKLLNAPGAYDELDVFDTYATAEGQEVPDGLAARLRIYRSASPDDNVPTDPYLAARLGEPVLPMYPGMTHVVLLGPAAEVNVFRGDLTTQQKVDLEQMLAWNKALATGVQLSGFVGSSPNIPPLKLGIRRLPDIFSTLTSAIFANGGAFTVPFAGNLYSTADYNAFKSWFDYASNIDGDANPAFIIYEALTTRLQGVGPRLSYLALDTDAFLRAADVLRTEGLGCSFTWDVSRPVSELVADVLKQAYGNLFINERTGQLQLSLVREADEPVHVFDDSNIIEFQGFSRLVPLFAPNEVQVPFADRALAYEERTLSAQNLALIQQLGAVVSQESRFIGVSNGNLASTLATREMRLLSTPLAKVALSAFLPAGKVLKPGQVVQVSHEKLGQTLRCRVSSARFMDYNNRNRIELEAVEDVFRGGNTSFNTIVSPPPALGGGSSTPGSLVSPVLTYAPYALTARDGYDYALYYAEASGTNTRAYELAAQENRTTWSNAIEPSYTGVDETPAISGTLNTALLAATATTTATINLTAAAAAAWAAAPREGRIFGIVGSEWFACSTFTLTGTTLSLTGIERGVLDTVPGYHVSGTKVVLLTGYAVYEQRLTTRQHNGGSYLSGLNSLTVRADSKGSGGTLFAVEAAASTASLSYKQTDSARSLAPLPPGAISRGGAWGAATLTETLPQLTRQDLVFTWVNRNRLDAEVRSWYSPTESVEPGTVIDWDFAWEVTPGSGSFSSTITGTAAAGATSLSVSVASVPSGARAVRLRMTAKRTVSGSNVVRSERIERYWQLKT